MIKKLKALLGLDYYTSTLDDFLHEFDETQQIHSSNQPKEEYAASQKINWLRDHAKNT